MARGCLFLDNIKVQLSDGQILVARSVRIVACSDQCGLLIDAMVDLMHSVRTATTQLSLCALLPMNDFTIILKKFIGVRLSVIMLNQLFLLILLIPKLHVL